MEMLQVIDHNSESQCALTESLTGSTMIFGFLYIPELWQGKLLKKSLDIGIPSQAPMLKTTWLLSTFLADAANGMARGCAKNNYNAKHFANKKSM